MTGIIFIVLAFVALAIFLLLPKSAKLSTKNFSRETYLNSMQGYLKGKREIVEGMEDSYRILFAFDGVDMIFEDIMEASFKQKQYKGFLKVKTSSNLSLYFSEKGTTGIRFSRVMMSDIAENSGPTTVQIPKIFKVFNIFSNDPARVNRLFESDRALGILREFKNVDSLGKPFMALEILDGEIALRFNSTSERRPTIIELNHGVSSIEKYIYLVMELRNFINGMYEK